MLRLSDTLVLRVGFCPIQCRLNDRNRDHAIRNPTPHRHGRM